MFRARGAVKFVELHAQRRGPGATSRSPLRGCLKPSRPFSAVTVPSKEIDAGSVRKICRRGREGWRFAIGGVEVGGLGSCCLRC